MKKLLRKLFFLSVVATFSCSKDEIPSRSDDVYFPLTSGSFSEFDVERTTFSFSALPEVSRFTTRQMIGDSFIDINNQLIYKVEFSVLNNKFTWKADSLVPVWKTFDKILGQENGQIVTKMMHPLANELTWNGNLYNSMNEKIFRVKDLGMPFKDGKNTFLKTVTIIRQDDSTLLSKNKYIEIYAANVGLIRTEKIFVQYCSTPDCIGKGIIESGWKEISVINKYGK